MGYANSVPYEIIAAPFTVWWAAVGTAFPAIDAAPASPWALVGTSGDLNIMDDGIQIELPQKFEFFRALGDAAVRKVFRVEEGANLSFTIADLTLEQFRHALNMNTITTVAASSGVAGYKSIGLSRGFSVATQALLMRGPSPYGDGMTWQLEIPRGAQIGSPKTAFRRNQPVGLDLQWESLVDPSAANASERIGKIKAQTAVAL